MLREPVRSRGGAFETIAPSQIEAPVSSRERCSPWPTCPPEIVKIAAAPLPAAPALCQNPRRIGEMVPTGRGEACRHGERVAAEMW